MARLTPRGAPFPPHRREKFLSRLWLRSALAVFAAALIALAGCGGDDEDPEPPDTAAEQEDRADTRDGEEGPREAQVRTIATGLDTPWEIAFLPDGRALVTERGGSVRLLTEQHELAPEPVARVDVDATGEGGLLGLAVDPEFEENGFVYLYRTAGGENQVLRHRFDGNTLEEDGVVVDGIPAGPIHNGGRMHFGPDERLYVTTGDAGVAELAQDESSLAGKLLRLGPDLYRQGRGAPEIHSLGHRNPQGFDWEPGSERLIASEHGASANDEVNIVERGENYGWPTVEGPDHGDFTAPVRAYSDVTIAPSGATFVAAEGSAWTGDFLIAGLAGEQLRRVRIDGREIARDDSLLEGELGRLRTVVEGPDRALYVLTSNRDGRGSPDSDDDRIVRIVPPGGG